MYFYIKKAFVYPQQIDILAILDTVFIQIDTCDDKLLMNEEDFEIEPSTVELLYDHLIKG